MNPFPMAARVSVAAAVLALSGCYYVGPYPYGYYGAAPYPAYPAYPGAAPSGATQRDPALEQTHPSGPGGPGPEDEGPNANDDGAGPPPSAQSQAQAQAPVAGYAPPPVVVAPAYYPAYPAYYPPYYGYGYGYGYPGWWGPSVSLHFGFGGHGGYHHH
ncbi:hypothetical protein [Paraburkholderia solisilvae]|uniref:Uncharacterized protein n=1 Tax=Paraburkholderia solisilvae TaxID=624376 RepID=A0A6J5EM04_9BURK|nr:hypothetical protein [Paraburkholderia solisilvae]CAB3767213.1 hypothetical protein LMG29739_05026 [Paraburkholderia solisilvae]